MEGRPKPSDPSASIRLAKQKQRDTKPELIVRRIVHSLGFRFRLNNRELPGSPDLANRTRKWAIFVHGCYWHSHKNCPRATVPKSNRNWWIEKFEANRKRDKKKEDQLRNLGFRVIKIWECQLLDLGVVTKRLSKELS